MFEKKRWLAMLLWLYKCRRLREKSSTDIVRRGRIRKRKKMGKKNEEEEKKYTQEQPPHMTMDDVC